VTIGRLVEVDLREVWAHEALSFTPWLLENADVLADALGIELELEAAEHAVGGFSLDLLGRDLTNECTLIVENQVEPTDHGHLGQLLTYAGGVPDVGTVVWLAKMFRDEHRQALDWLNDHTGEDVRFFGVALRAVRIGDSAPAPLLDVVAKPNDWQKRVRTATTRVGEREKAYEAFWESLVAELRQRAPSTLRLRSNKAPTSSYLGLASRVEGAATYASFGSQHIRVELYIDTGDAARNLEIFGSLVARRAEIERRFGGQLDFDPSEGKRICKVLVRRETSPSPILSPELHDELRGWFVTTIERFLPAFESGELSPQAPTG
jgi:hypothetical protein